MTVIVVKVGGKVSGSAGQAAAGLVRALRAGGWSPVVVHGGGDEVSAWQRRLGLPVQFRDGRRVTDEATLELVEMVLTGRVNRAWVAALQQEGLEAAGISGRDGSLIVAEPPAPGGEDLGRVGTVKAVNPALARALLDAGIVPVVSPVARDGAGRAINVNADEAAAALAGALGASLLLLCTDVPGLLADPGDPASLVPVLAADEARAHLARGSAAGGMRPKLEAALAALAQGVPRVQILDGTDPAALGAVAAALPSPDGARPELLPGTAVVGGAAGTARRPEPADPTSQWTSRGAEVLMNTYARQPLVAWSGSGARLTDAGGREWLDFIGGLAVTSLGHAHPRVAARIAAQARRLLHVSNLFWIPQQVELAERLRRLSGLDRWFFCTSGAEANEAAIKLARRHGLEIRGPECCEIVAAVGSFHGRTLGALSATGQDRYRQGFGPLVPGFRHVPYGDLDAVARALDERVCAVLVEPIQGESGVRVPPAGYLRGLRELCDRHGVLLILDEVQTGIGRTGRWFAFQHDDVLPDVVTLAKALAGGVPIGAVGAREAVAARFRPGDHASTFGGNPLACAAALETLQVLEEEGLVERAAVLGERFAAALRSALAGNPLLVEVRGRGLMIGIALRGGARAAAEGCRDRGLLVNAVGDEVLRLLPPLTVDEEDLAAAAAIIAQSLAEVARSLAAVGPQEVAG